MKTFLCASLLNFILISTVVFAEDSPLTPIQNADLVCSGSHAMVAINTQKQKVWLADPGDTEGAELTIGKFLVSKCPDCYDITATFSMMGQDQHFKLEIRGQIAANPQLTLFSISDIENPDSDSQKIGEFSCQKP